MTNEQVLLFALAVALIAATPLVLIATSPLWPTAPSAPLSVVSFESVAPYSPAGPTVTLTVQNVGAFPEIALSAVLQMSGLPTFYFLNINATHPLGMGMTATSVTNLGPVAISCGTTYSLEFRGMFLGGDRFDFTASPILGCE